MRIQFPAVLYLVGFLTLFSYSTYSQSTGPSALISGTEAFVTSCIKPSLCTSGWTTGTITISANGSNASVDYGQGSTATSLASALCSKMGSSFPVKCTSTSAGTIFISDPSAYTVSGSVASDFPISGNGSHAFSITFPAITGFVNLKYLIVGVTYAPPGSRSFVNYANSTSLGSATALGSSIKNTVTQSVAVSSGGGGSGTFPVVGTVGWSDTTTTTNSQSFTQEQDTSSSVALSSTTTWSKTVPGPASDYVGVNHDYDVIWLWLNPLVNFSMHTGPANITWTGYSFDTDDVAEMDIYGVYLGWLTGRLSTPGPGSTDFSPLQRAWAGLPSNGQIWPAGTTPALTATDYAQIASVDPFSSLSYTVTVPTSPLGNLTSSDGRYTVTGNQTVDYVQPGPGGQPFTQALAESTSLTQTQGQSASHQVTTGYSLENKFNLTFFGNSWQSDVTNSTSLTLANQWSKTNSKVTGETATGSVTGPACVISGSACNPVYTGPTEYSILEDNIYGTYMFYPTCKLNGTC